MDTQTENQCRLSGGETVDSEAYRRLRALLAAEADVHEVLALSYVPEDRKWLYLIKTPFATWPKFVIGETDSENANPELIFRCGAEWSAWSEWEKLNTGDHQ